MKPKRRRKNTTEICSFCGEQSARLYLKNQTFGQGARMIIIENVPTFVCDNCRESYITAFCQEENVGEENKNCPGIEL